MKKSNRWKKIWHFIWDDDSIWSWIVNIGLAFLLIKFIVYPGLGLILGTNFPVVAVVSGSMEHEGASFDKWWASNFEFYEEFSITEEAFSKFPFRNGFNTGDIMVLRGLDPSKIEVGDVIVFNSKRPDPIIHRVIKKWEEDGMYHCQTTGDHNSGSIVDRTLNEKDIHQDMVIGKAVFRIPWLGWIKIGFFNLIKMFL
jgi:signal peptidase I